MEQDVERLLKDEMHRSRKSFKHTLNQAIRAGLKAASTNPKRERFVVKARPMGLRPGIDPFGLNKMVDELEVDAYLEKHKHRP